MRTQTLSVILSHFFEPSCILDFEHIKVFCTYKSIIVWPIIIMIFGFVYSASEEKLTLLLKGSTI